MMEVKRAIRVTATLLAMGGIFGAICGVAIVAIMLLLLGGGVGELFDRDSAELLLRVAAFGAVTGAIGWTALAWLLLRRVPLGKALSWTALGCVVGAIAGEIWAPFNPYTRAIPGMLQGAGLGFLGAGVILRFTSGRQRSMQGEPSNER